MTKNLSRFLPLLLRSQLTNKQHEVPAGVMTRHEGACMFADVSGFTAMSEQLAILGREGAEELTGILNRFYEAMVSEILDQHGDIIKFAGDAMTVFFENPAGLERASHTACSMQQLMTQFDSIETPAGSFRLQMKIGLAQGLCNSALVGDESSADFLFAGEIVDQAADAEHKASAGEIWLYRPKKSVQIKEAPALKTPLLSETISKKSIDIKRFLPPVLIEKIGQKRSGFINEHRRVSILFVSFHQAEKADQIENVLWIHEFYQLCLEISRSYDGYINKIDMGDKGAKLIILFGAPMAHEDDADRACLSAFEIRDRAAAMGIITSIGLNSDSIFAGIVGSERRCEYTVMGDGVNLSARLMSAATPGSIYCHQKVRTLFKREYNTRDLPPLVMKGKKESQPVIELISRHEVFVRTCLELCFTGRTQELEKIDTFLAVETSGSARVIDLRGPQGIGKTTLLAEQFNNFEQPLIYLGTAHDYTRNTAYYPWKQILRDALVDYGSQQQKLSEVIDAILAEQAPQLLPYASLISTLIGDADSNPLVENLDAESRESILWKIILEIIDAVSQRGQLVCILDNVQWLDERSTKLFRELVLTIDFNNPVFVISGRERSHIDVSGTTRLELELKPFSEVEASSFARRFLTVRDIPEKVIDKLMQLSKGVPLVAQEVLNSFVQSGYLERSDEYEDLLLVNDLALTKIPDTLDGMVLSRFDMLSVGSRKALRLMSVFGEEMAFELAPEVFELEKGTPPDKVVTTDLESFIQFNAEWQVLQFVQPYFRTVIYESINFASRRKLHRELGEICRLNLARNYLYRNEILAYHFSQGNDARSATPYLRKVVAKSVHNNAYTVAVEQYERLISFEQKLKQTESATSHQLELAELLNKLGEFNRARELLEDLKLVQTVDSEKLAQAYFLLGEVNQLTADFDESLQHFSLASKVTASPLLTMNAKRQIGSIYARKGDFSLARDHFRELIQTSQDFSDRPEFGSVLLNLGMTEFFLGHLNFQRFTAALEIFHQAGDYYNELKLLNNMGQIEERQGAYRKSLTYFLQAFDKASQYGFNHLLCMILSNLGLAQFHLFNLEEAQSYYEKSLLYGSRFNKNSINLMLTMINLAEVKRCLGDYDHGLELYLKAETMIEQLKFPRADFLLEICFFLYQTGIWPTLKKRLKELERELGEDPLPAQQVAVGFYRAILEKNRESRKKQLGEVVDSATTHKQANFFYAGQVELFELYSSSDPAMAEKCVLDLQSARSRATSRFSILSDVCELRQAGSDVLIRRIDRALARYPWPEYSWQRHLWIGEHYWNTNKVSAARKRMGIARQEWLSIVNTISSSELRQAFRKRHPGPFLESHPAHLTNKQESEGSAAEH